MPAKISPEERAPSSRATYALTNGLNARHRQVMRELVAGATHAQAAARCGYGVERVRQLVQSPLFREEMMKMEDRVDEKFEGEVAGDTASVSSILRNAAPKAAEKLVELSKTGKSETIKLASVRDILDRTGHKAPDEVVATLSVDADEGLKHMLGEMAKEKKENASA